MYANIKSGAEISDENFNKLDTRMKAKYQKVTKTAAKKPAEVAKKK